MITVKGIAWTAGFLEGEGYFEGRIRDKAKGMGASVSIQVVQKQREPLLRLKRFFGGKVRRARWKAPKGSCWRWTRSGLKSIEIMMTIYCLMSPWRQKQIRQSLHAWKSSKGRSYNIGEKPNHADPTRKIYMRKYRERLRKSCVALRAI